LKQCWSTIPPILTKAITSHHLNSLNTKINRSDMALEIQFMAFDRHNNMVGLNDLMGSQHFSSG
jgi:hypothetical protein